MKLSLRQASKQYFESGKLSDEQLKILQNNITETGHHESRHTMWSVPKLAGIIFIVLASLFIFTFFPATEENLSIAIAKEAVKNHLKLKPLEIQSNQFNTVSKYFTQLDFSLVPSSHLGHLNANMLGGRYCSIQSITAAQLRYLDAEGELISLYEVGYDQAVFGIIPNIDNNEQPITHYINGLNVDIWVEKGLLMTSVKK